MTTDDRMHLLLTKQKTTALNLPELKELLRLTSGQPLLRPARQARPRPVNSTSTKVPMWQIDCQEFFRTRRPFELREVTTPEHLDFVRAFAAQRNLEHAIHGTSVHFEQRPVRKLTME